MHWANLTNVSLLLLYTTPVTAEPAYPAIPLGGLDGYPTLKLLAAMLTVFIPALGALLYLKANYFKPKDEPITIDVGGVKIDAANVMFYQGPLKAIYDLLTDIRGRQALNRLEVRDDMAALLSQSRTALDASVGNALRDFETRHDRRIETVQNNINSLHERIDDVNENLIRIDTKVSIRSGQ